MWETFKEAGFTVISTGAFCALFTLFVLVQAGQITTVGESNSVILWIEILSTAGMIVWGVTRFINETKELP